MTRLTSFMHQPPEPAQRVARINVGRQRGQEAEAERRDHHVGLSESPLREDRSPGNDEEPVHRNQTRPEESDGGHDSPSSKTDMNEERDHVESGHRLCVSLRHEAVSRQVAGA